MDRKRVTTIGTWKVRTLNTVGGNSLLMHELSHFRWDVIGLEERFEEFGRNLF